MKVKDFIQNINWECSSLERVLVDTGTERIELPGEVLRRPASKAWREEFLAALNMTVREARVISVDTMVIFAVSEEEGGENMNDRDGSIELRLNTKNVDEALSKVRELYAAIEKANAAATALAKMLDGLTVWIDYV